MVPEPQSLIDVDSDDLKDEDFTSEVVFEDAYTLHDLADSPGDVLMDDSEYTEPIASISNTRSAALSTPKRASLAKRALIQTKLPFKSISLSEYRAQESRRYHVRMEESARESERLELADTRKKMKRRERERIKKREQRARKRKVRAKLLQLSSTVGTKSKVRHNALIIYVCSLTISTSSERLPTPCSIFCCLAVAPA